MSFCCNQHISLMRQVKVNPFSLLLLQTKVNLSESNLKSLLYYQSFTLWAVRLAIDDKGRAENIKALKALCNHGWMWSVLNLQGNFRGIRQTQEMKLLYYSLIWHFFISQASTSLDSYPSRCTSVMACKHPDSTHSHETEGERHWVSMTVHP